MSGTIYTEQSVLGHTLGFRQMLFPAQVFVGLCSAAIPPSETVSGVEVFGGGYTRMLAQFALIDTPANIAANVASLEYPSATGSWGTLGYFELWDSASGGNRLYWGPLVDPTTGLALNITVASGDIVRFSAGTLAVQAVTGTGSTGSVGAYLPLSGGAMLGPMWLAGDPTDYLQPATKQYVDAHSGTGGGPGFLPLSGGAMLGPLTLSGNATLPLQAVPLQQVSAAVGAVANVKDPQFGAKGDGTTDDTAAIRAALAISPARNVYLPAGSYRITDSLTVGASNVDQRLYGDGPGSVLLVDTTFNSTALGVVILTGAQTPLATHPAVEHLTIQFAVPVDATATLASASGTTLNLTGPVPASVIVGDYVTDDTDWAGIQANSITRNANPPIEGSKVVSIGTNSVTISLPVVAGHIAAGHLIRFGHTRSMFRNLGAAPPPSTVVGGYGAKYPWAIYVDFNYASGGGLPLINDVKINGAWNGIWCHSSQNFRITNCPIGAMSVGVDIEGGGDGGFMENVWFNAYGIYVPAFTSNTAFGQVWYDGTTKSWSIGRTDGIFMNNIGTFNCIAEIKPTWTFGQITNMDQDFPSAQFIIGAHTGVLQITNFRGQKITMNGGADFSNFLIDGSGSPAPFMTIGGSLQPFFVNGQFICQPGGIVVQGSATPHIRDCVFSGAQGTGTSWANGLVQVQSGCAISLMACEFVTSGVGPGLTIATDTQWQNVKSNFWGNCTFTPPGSAGTYEAGLPTTQGGITAAGTTQGTAYALTAPLSNVSTVAAGSGVILPAWAAVGSRWIVLNHGANALLCYAPVGHSIFGASSSQSIAANGQLVMNYFGGSVWFVEA